MPARDNHHGKLSDGTGEIFLAKPELRLSALKILRINFFRQGAQPNRCIYFYGDGDDHSSKFTNYIITVKNIFLSYLMLGNAKTNTLFQKINPPHQ